MPTMSSVVNPSVAVKVLGVIALFHLFTIASSAVVKMTQVVRTSSGPVRGKIVTLPNNKTTLQFLGIRYGKAGRFEKPKVEKWEGTFHATDYGKACPQAKTTLEFGVKSQEEISEDCLTLNVFVPEMGIGVKDENRLPVFVWIAGFFYSFGNAAKLDGSFLASNGDVIVVTFNYRLGALGYLNFKSGSINGNFGLWDQALALKWVSQNINRFGGDPRRVTLMGHSAGAMSAGLLLVSPQAQNLFSRVVLMSGSPLSLAAMVKPNDAEERARRLGKALGCINVAELKKCLKTKTVENITTAQAAFQNTPITSPFAPVVDGELLEDLPSVLLKSQKLQVSSVMIGLADDGNILMAGQLPGVSTGGKPYNTSTFEQIIKDNKLVDPDFRGAKKIISYVYTNWDDPDDLSLKMSSLTDMYSDAAFRAPATRMANLLSQRGLPTYLYQFDCSVPNKDKLPGVPIMRGCPHGHDVEHLMNGVAGENSLSEVFVRMLASFARTGDPTPNNTGILHWPPYKLPQGRYMSLQDTPSVHSRLSPARMALWNNLLPSLASDEVNMKQRDVGSNESPTTPSNNKKTCPKDKTAKALIAVVSVMAIVIIIMLSIIVYQGRALSKQAEGNSGNSARQPLR